jgi:uncharacterized membrane protein (DUF2068 family)
MPRDPSRARILRLIALFKLFKGLLLLAIGIGALKMLHQDVAAEVARWADVFRVDPGNEHLQHRLARLAALDDRKLRALSVGTFFYSALLLTEGFGLWFRKTWAEYFTILITASFIPLEVYELIRRPNLPKIAVLLVNIAIVAYLVFEVRREQRTSPDPAPPSKENTRPLAVNRAPRPAR